MARTLQRLAIVLSIVVCLIAYLSHVPNSQGVPQMNRIRLLSASMKIFNFVGFISETLGIAPAWYVQRNSGSLLRLFKSAENNINLNIKDVTIEGVPVRIYSPLKFAKNQLLPAIIFYHGGAFYMGSVESHHPITKNLALRTGFIVISVDYRLAPEYPFPAGLNDCMTVTKYVLQENNAKKLNIDVKRVAIAGDSAGANLAAVISNRFASDSTNVNVPRVQISIYPVVQFFDFRVPSYLMPVLKIFSFGRRGQVLEFYLNESITDDAYNNNHTTIEQKRQYRKYVDWSLIPSKYRQIYREPKDADLEGSPTLVKNAQVALTSDVSPLLVEDEILAKVPATYVVTVGHDRLRDEGFIYAGRLKANGVKVVHRHYENTFHGSLTFLERPFTLEIAHEMLNDIVDYLKNNL